MLTIFVEEILKDETSTDIQSPEKSQPACTALQLALVDLLRSWGIQPSAVVGHSSGEIAAAYCSGALSLEASIKVAHFRGLLSNRLRDSKSLDGSMCAVSMSPVEVLPHLRKAIEMAGTGRLEIGCINSPNNITITGDRCCIALLKQNLDDKQVFARQLAVDVPYHSPYMKAIAAEYRDYLGGQEQLPSGRVEAVSERASLFSSVTGTLVTDAELCQPEYWVSNLVRKVDFLSATKQMLSSELSDAARTGFILEIGPHSALQRPIMDILRLVDKEKTCTYGGVLSRTDSTASYSLGVLGSMCCRNVPMNLSAINQVDNSKRKLAHLIDLPQYPFNHSQRYWQESRISSNYRHRTHRRHELLGVRVADWNPLRPTWRNVIRHAEHPWLKDHVVDGSVSYPPAGLVVMAIEGASQIADPDKRIFSYELREISFKRSLDVPVGSENVETQLYFSPRRPNYTSLVSRESQGYDFSICAWTGDDWLEHCTGTVFVKYVSGSSDTAGLNNLSAQNDVATDSEKPNATYREVIESSIYYQNIADLGFEFGPSFRKLKHIQYTDSEIACGSIDVGEWKHGVEVSQAAPCVIHPTDLEAIFGIGLVATSGGGWNTAMKSRLAGIARISISNSMLTPVARASLQLMGKVSHYLGDTSTSVLVTDHLQSAVVQVEDQRSILWATEKTLRNQLKVQRLCYSIQWKPDITLLDSGALKDFMLMAGPPMSMPPGVEVMWQELICLHYTFLARRTLNKRIVADAPPHLQQYRRWMDHVFDHGRYTSLLESVRGFANAHARENFIRDFAKRSPTAALMVETGRSLVSIFHGKQDGLDLLFNGGLAESFYHNDGFQVSYRQIASYLDLLAHKQPGLRILEIGAGTGAATLPIIETLSFKDTRTGTSRFSNYTYTDISPGFFEKAREKFHYCRGRMTFKVLDIEKEPEEQSFQTDSFDVVLACLVLHATSNLARTLKHLHKLLKPGGKLIMFEPTNPTSCRSGFSFGLVPGWWLSVEPNRKWSPLISDQEWDHLLKTNNFSGNDVCIPDYADEVFHTQSVIISTAQDVHVQPAMPKQSEITLVINETSAYQQEVAWNIKQSLEERQYACSTLDISRIQKPKVSHYVLLVEIEKSFLGDICEVDFETLKRVVDSARSLLWVTVGNGLRPTNPEFGIATGFGRNVVSEKLHTSFAEVTQGRFGYLRHRTQSA